MVRQAIFTNCIWPHWTWAKIIECIFLRYGDESETGYICVKENRMQKWCYLPGKLHVETTQKGYGSGILERNTFWTAKCATANICCKCACKCTQWCWKWLDDPLNVHKRPGQKNADLQDKMPWQKWYKLNTSNDGYWVWKTLREQSYQARFNKVTSTKRRYLFSF